MGTGEIVYGTISRTPGDDTGTGLLSDLESLFHGFSGTYAVYVDWCFFGLDGGGS